MCEGCDFGDVGAGALIRLRRSKSICMMGDGLLASNIDRSIS